MRTDHITLPAERKAEILDFLETSPLDNGLCDIGALSGQPIDLLQITFRPLAPGSQQALLAGLSRGEAKSNPFPPVSFVALVTVGLFPAVHGLLLSG